MQVIKLRRQTKHCLDECKKRYGSPRGRGYYIWRKVLQPKAMADILVVTFFVLLVIFKIISFEDIAGELENAEWLAPILLITISYILVAFLGRIVLRKVEDSMKLTIDYGALVSKYARTEMITSKRGVKKGEESLLLVQKLAFRDSKENPFMIEISQENANKRYVLPSQISNHTDYILEAHKHSDIYNNMCVRLDDIRLLDNRITLIYSQTFYYDSIITNRSMDYIWDNGKTIREIYEPGPFLSDLKDSKLSNHLGFNGYIETSDGYIIFVKRGKSLSVAKDLIGSSIGASLKTKYALDDDKRLQLQGDHFGLEYAIRKEIEDELKLKVDSEENMLDSIFAFYRDILEGGKPQFLFYYKIQQSKEEVVQAFYGGVKQEASSKEPLNGTVVDGTQLLFFTKNELAEGIITNDYIQPKGYKRKLKTLPSVAGTLELLMQYVE